MLRNMMQKTIILILTITLLIPATFALIDYKENFIEIGFDLKEPIQEEKLEGWLKQISLDEYIFIGLEGLKGRYTDAQILDISNGIYEKLSQNDYKCGVLVLYFESQDPEVILYGDCMLTDANIGDLKLFITNGKIAETLNLIYANIVTGKRIKSPNFAPTISVTGNLVTFGNTKDGFIFNPIVLNEGEGADSSQVTLVSRGINQEKAFKLSHRVIVEDDNTKGDVMKDHISVGESDNQKLTIDTGSISDDQLPLTLDKVIVAEDDGSLISGIKKDPQRSEIQAKITLCPTGDADHMLDRGRSKLNLEIDTGKLKDVFDFLFRIIREGKVSDQATSKLGKAIAGDAFSNKIIPWSPNDKIKIDVNLNKVDLFMEPGSEFCGYPTVHSISTITSESGTGMKNLLDIYNDQRTLGTQTAEQGVISLILAGNEGNPLYVKHLVDMVLKDLGLDFERLVPARMKTALETKDTRKVAISIELTTALEGETAVLKAIVQRSYQEKTGWRKWEDVNLPTETIPLSIGKDDIKAYLNKYTLNIDEMIKIFDTMKKNKDEPNEEFSLRKGEITVLNLGITKLTINWKIEPKRNGGEHFEFNSLGVMSVGLDTDIPLEKGTGLTDCCVAVFPTGLYSNSIYMLREENEGRSGIAYQFLPDMAFQEPVERTFKSKTEQQIIRVYTDQDIEDCNLQVLSETTNPVDIEGTTIDTPDLTFTIPPFATSERKDITIRKIMLDCPSCTNGIQDSDEEGVDCGGSCMTPCENCFNGIMDSNEEGIDCGGACIIELDIEELPGLDQNHDCITTEPKYDSCYTDQDCIGSCKEGLTPICSNYTELCTCVKEEVCGNHFCEFYENLGQTCDEDCSQPNCNDYIQNQDETAVDEGGICGLAPSEIDEIKNERFSDIQTLICTGDCSSPSNILKLEDNIKIIVSNPVKALTRGYYEDQWGMRENIHFVNNAAVFHTKTPGTYKAVILISKAGYDDYSETLYFSVNEQTLNTWLIIIPLLIIIALIAGVVIWTRHKQNTIPK